MTTPALLLLLLLLLLPGGVGRGIRPRGAGAQEAGAH
jgi:hypothetical protein